MANLQSTFASEAKLRIRFPAGLALRVTTGKNLQVVTKAHAEDFWEVRPDDPDLCIGLGGLQFGMSKDIYLEYEAPIQPDEPDNAGSAEKATEKSRSVEDATTALIGKLSGGAAINVELNYKPLAGEVRSLTVRRSPLSFDDPPETEVAYHISRSQLCSFLSSLFPFQNQERQRCEWGQEKTTLEDRIAINGDTKHELQKCKEAMPAWRLTVLRKGGDDCASLIQDVEGSHPHGQIGLSLSQRGYWETWGRHYLLSLLDAHTRQACNSFKDPGPLRYGRGSPLFLACRARLDEAFDTIEPPEPSRTVRRWVVDGASAEPPRPLLSMGEFYNNAQGSCFAATTRVRLADDQKDGHQSVTAFCVGAEGGGGGDGDVQTAAMPGATIRICDLRRGMRVLTPLGARAVAAVVRTRVRQLPVCRIGDGGVIVTPWHPVKKASANAGAGNCGGHSGSERVEEKWAFPAKMPEARLALYTGSVFSVMLEPDGRPDAHAILVASPSTSCSATSSSARGGRLWGVTLGHGLAGRQWRREEKGTRAASTDGGESAGGEEGDVRTHEFWGDYHRVAAELARLQGGAPRGTSGVVLCTGVRRSRNTGRVVGLRGPPSSAADRVSRAHAVATLARKGRLGRLAKVEAVPMRKCSSLVT